MREPRGENLAELDTPLRQHAANGQHFRWRQSPTHYAKRADP